MNPIGSSSNRKQEVVVRAARYEVQERRFNRSEWGIFFFYILPKFNQLADIERKPIKTVKAKPIKTKQ